MTYAAEQARLARERAKHDSFLEGQEIAAKRRSFENYEKRLETSHTKFLKDQLHTIIRQNTLEAGQALIAAASVHGNRSRELDQACQSANRNSGLSGGALWLILLTALAALAWVGSSSKSSISQTDGSRENATLVDQQNNDMIMGDLKDACLNHSGFDCHKAASLFRSHAFQVRRCNYSDGTHRYQIRVWGNRVPDKLSEFDVPGLGSPFYRIRSLTVAACPARLVDFPGVEAS